MSGFDLSSPSEQVAEHLRSELFRGRWHGTMPGSPTLAAELGVDGKTVWAALGLLEAEGLLTPQGTGRPRKITLPKGGDVPALRVCILDYEPLEKTEGWSIAMQQQLVAEGHNAFFTNQSLIELGMDVRRVSRLVKRTPAAAWLVCSGSRDVVKWFAGQKMPVFALFGRREGLPLAGVGPDHVSAGRKAVRRLIELGHQRIVILARKSQRAGSLGIRESAILEEIKSHGLATGPYNLPDWEDSSEGFHQILDQLFRVTPPTALIIDEPFLFHAAKECLAQRGILAPRHVSLICTDPDPTFSWCRPSVSHFRWDHRPVVRRVLRWVANVARGKRDIQQTLTKAEFVEGGTIGPAPKV